MALNLLFGRLEMRLTALLVALVSSAVFAQTLTQISLRRLDDLTLDTYTFGAGACGDTITVRWTNSTTLNFITQCSSSPVMKIWSTAGECASTPGSGDVRYDDIPALTLQGIKQGSFAVKVSELPGFSTTLTTDGGVVSCGATGLTKHHRICGDVEYTPFTGVSCGTVTHTAASPLKLVYDTQPPGAPTLTEYAAQDQGVKIGFTYDTDTSVVSLEVRAQGEVDYRQIAEAIATNKVVLGKNLVNNTTYDVRIRARDAAGNISDPSVSVSVTPIKTLGFYGFYRNAGGTETGCSASPGLAVLLGAGFLFRRRRGERS